MASGAQLGAEFKSVAADVAGYLDSLIDKANGFINSLNAVMELRRAAVRRFDAYADAIDIVVKDAAGAAQDVDQLTRVIDRVSASGRLPYSSVGYS